MKIEEMKPIGEKILVKKIREKDKFIGSIFIPNKEKHKMMQAEVVALGKGVKMENGEFRPYDVGVGDKILTGKYASVGGEIPGNDDFLIITEADIFGVLEYEG